MYSGLEREDLKKRETGIKIKDKPKKIQYIMRNLNRS